MRPLLLASRSPGKLRELLPLLGAEGLRAETLCDAAIPEDSAEDGIEVFDTFEANALAKARWFSAIVPGRAVLADDSGLVVDALQGRPGVASKRWSNRPDLAGTALDEANNAMLLAALDTRGERDARTPATARYLCAAACVWPGGERVVSAETAGRIVTASRGTQGFGYDPYFLSDELGKTFGEATLAEKGRVSHRARAFRALLVALRPMLLATPENLSWKVDRTGGSG